MNFLSLIPARGGSKGIPNKNIKLLDGKPLIYYSIEVAKKAKLIDRVVVSTDSKEIVDMAKIHGVEITLHQARNLESILGEPTLGEAVLSCLRASLVRIGAPVPLIG